MTKHTEGPWLAASGPSSIVGWPVVAQSGRAICSMTTPPAGINRVGKDKAAYDEFMAECAANAKLVAAAPELLIAAQNAREFIDASAFNLLTKNYFDAVTKELDAAIAKASA